MKQLVNTIALRENNEKIMDYLSGHTLSAVCHASLRRLQQVNIEVSTVAHGDRDAEHAAVFAGAWEKLPGSAGRQLPHL